MQFKNLAIIASVAAAAAAAPAPQASPLPSGTTFGLIAMKPGSKIQNSAFSASQGSLWLKHPQDADCESKSDFATFIIEQEELFLYNTTKVSKQQVFTDRSGMGQGVVEYTAGEVALNPNRIETKGWAFTDQAVLQFEGTDFIACPYQDSYSVWLNAGVANPGGSSDCIPFTAKVVTTSDPVSCIYSNQPQ